MNDYGEELFDPQTDDATWRTGVGKFRSRGAELAAWTQQELGADYEVPFVTSTGAWQWVEPPWSQSDSV